MYFSGKTVEESARKPFGLNRRHETGVLRLPQRRHDKVGLPPSAPAFQRANRNPQFLSKPRRRWYLPGMPGRYQRRRGLERNWGFRFARWNAGADGGKPTLS